jgi:hypothetical protein
MENQHQLIKGYRDLSQAEIDLINRGKSLAVLVGEWIAELESIRSTPESAGPDPRWLAIGKTDLQNLQVGYPLNC